MLDQKKSQFLIIAAVFFILLIIFIYSLETSNSYKSIKGESSIVENIMEESCQISYNNNGSNLDEFYSNYTSEVSSYCSSRGYSCNLKISKKASAPANESRLNSSHYDYELEFDGNSYYTFQNFTC